MVHEGICHARESNSSSLKVQNYLELCFFRPCYRSSTKNAGVSLKLDMNTKKDGDLTSKSHHTKVAQVEIVERQSQLNCSQS